MYDLLSGLKIIEVSSFVASPTAGLYLAQMGADVVRIDHKAGGLDYDRYLVTREGRSLSWENLNRAKKSLALDLSSAEGRELAAEMVRKTGQMITNLPLASFLPHDKLAEQCPGLVSVRIMGWHDGRQAMDFTVNAASGYPLMTGPEDWDPASAPPVNQVLPAWDFITGAYCAFAMLAGLRHRDATGQGVELRVPLGDVAIGTMANSGAMAEMLYRGSDRERLGNAIWGAFGRDFLSRDGKRFMVAALTAKQWSGVVEAIHRDSVLTGSWTVIPRVFVPRDLESLLRMKVTQIKRTGGSAQQMPEPIITALEDVLPWRYRSWNGEAFIADG